MRWIRGFGRLLGVSAMLCVLGVLTWKASETIWRYNDHLIVASYQIGRLDGVVEQSGKNSARLADQRHEIEAIRQELLAAKAAFDEEQRARLLDRRRIADLHRRLSELERGHESSHR